MNLDINHVKINSICNFINPKPKMLIEHEGLKLLVDIDREKNQEHDDYQVKILSLFINDLVSFTDGLDIKLKGESLGYVSEIINYDEVEMAFIICHVSDLNRKVIDAIFSELKDSYGKCLPTKRDNEDLAIDAMIYRGLLISYDSGGASDYTLNEWMKNITIG